MQNGTRFSTLKRSKYTYIYILHTKIMFFSKIVPARDPKQCVCVRSISRKSRDLDALGSREMMMMVVMKVGIVVTVAVVV